MAPDTNAPRGHRVRRRWLLFCSVGVGGLVVLLGAAHLPYVRAWVLASTLDRLRTGLGIHVSADRLDYNLLTLSVRMHGVDVTAEDSDESFFHADAIGVDLPWSIVGGTVAVQSLELERPRLAVVRREDGTLNLPRFAASSESSGPVTPIQIDRLLVRDLDFRYADAPAQLSVDGRGLSIDLARKAGAPLDGRLSLAGAITVRRGALQATMSEFGGRLAFDGTALTLEELTARLPEAQLRLDGTVDLLSNTARTDMHYTGSADLARLAPWLALDSPPRGVVAFSGRVNGPVAGPTATFDLTSDRLGWHGLDDIALRLGGSATSAVATVESFRVALVGGEVTGRARLPLGSTEPGMARVRWAGLDAGAIVDAAAADFGVRISSVASGTAALDWTGQDVLSARGSISNRLVPAAPRRGAVTIGGPAEARLDRGRWELSLDQRVAGAMTLGGRFDGRLDPRDLAASTVRGSASLEIARLQDALAALSAAGLARQTDAVLPLAADLAVRATVGGSLSSPTLTGAIDVAHLAYGEMGPGAAHARFEADRRRVTLDPVRMDLGPNNIAGRIDVGVDARTMTGELAADLPDLAALATLVPADWRPDGAARAHASIGGALDNPSIAATLQSDALRVAGQPAARVRTSARLEDQVVVVDSFEIDQDEGHVGATGRYTIADGRFAFDATGSSLAIHPVVRSAPLAAPTPPDGTPAGPIPIEARFDFHFNGTGTAEMPDAQGFVQFSRLAWDGYEIGDARVDAVVENASAQLTAKAPRLSTTVDAKVALAAPHAFTATGSLLKATLQQLLEPTGPAGVPAPAAPVRASTLAPATSPARASEPTPMALPVVGPHLTPDTVAGSVSARFTAVGSLDESGDSAVDVELLLEDVAVNGVPVRLVRPARLRYDARQIVANDFELQVGTATLLASGGLGPQRGGSGLRAALTGPLADLVPLAHLVPALGDVSASGALDIQMRVTGTVDAPEIDGEFSLASGSFASGAFPAVHDATLQASYARGLLDVRDVRAGWQGAQVTASAQIPATLLGDRIPEVFRKTLPTLPGKAKATARIESVTPAALASFMSEETLGQIAGRVDLVATLEAGSLDVNDVTGELIFDRAELAVARVPLSQSRPTRLRLADGRLDIVAWNWTGAGNGLDITGSARLSDEGPQLDLGINGTVDLRMLGAFSKDVVTAGLATLNLTVKGNPEEPALAGQIAVRDGNIVSRNPRVAVTDLNGSVHVAPDRLDLRDFAASANGGTLSIGGNLQYPGLKLTGGTVVITGRGLAFDTPEGLRTEIDADLQFAASQSASAVTGTVTILRGAYREPLSLAGVLLSGVDVQSGPSTGDSEAGFAGNTSLAINVVSAEDIAVDNNYGRLEIGSNLRIVGTLAQPALAGRLTVQEGGQVFLGGRRYQVSRGTVDFTSATAIEPNIDLSLETRVQSYDVTLEVRGTPETLEATLRSPGVSQADVVSLLLTGQLADAATVAQTEVARGQLLMLLSGEFLAFAGRSVGLDSVQVSRGLGGAASDFDLLATDADPGARLTIAKNLRSDVEVVYSQSLSESGSITWIALYRPLRGLELRGTTQDDGSRAYEFRNELAFGGGRRASPRPAAEASREESRLTDVTITGTPGFSEPELRRLLKLEAGDKFDFYRWQQDRDRLERFYEEHDFLEARISARRQDVPRPDGPTGTALEYRIERGPLAQLTVEGYNLPGNLVEEMKRTWSAAVYDGFLVEDLELMARQRLVADGYLRAEVSGHVAAQPLSDAKQVTLQIVPATRFDSRTIRFEGQDHVSADALDTYVKTRGLENDVWLRPEQLKAAVEQYYRSLGYLEASVSVGPPAFVERTATLPVRVTEGRPFEVARVDVAGADAVPEATLRDAFRIQAGSLYLPSLLEPARRNVETTYLKDGYNDARVSVATAVDPDRASVDVTLKVVEGRQQVLSSVEVTGATSTAESVITRALNLEPGKPASLTDYYRAQKRLYDTGVFRTADIDIQKIADADSVMSGPQPVRAVVTLEELARYRFRYGFRVNDRVGPTEAGREVRPAVVVDLLRRNLFSRAVSAGLAGQLERDRRLARGAVALPGAFGLPVTTSFFLTGSRQRFAPQSASPFVEDDLSFTAEQRFSPAKRMAVTYGYSFIRSHVFEPDPNPALPVLDLQSKVARLTGTFAWDRRDDPSNARTGWFQSSGLEVGTAALGSELRFIRYLAQQYYFKSVGKSLVLASAFRLGLGRGFGQDLIPSEKFYAGGGTSVRGFAEDGLGPLDFFGDPRGGNGLVLLNQEVRFPIFKWLRGAGFLDAGNVFSTVRAVSLSTLEAGGGVGVRIHSPFVLIRIDYGVPITSRGHQPSGRWYFAIGQTF